MGLAVARALARAGRETIVLESAERHGTGTSSRNSGVIHAGLYYPEGSLKASLCVRGRELLYEFAASRQVPHRRVGKLIVASQTREAALRTIVERAEAAGVLNLEWLDAQALARMEPALRADVALHSPSTGIIDAHGLMHALEGDLTDAGGMVAVCSRLTRVTPRSGGGFELTVSSGLGPDVQETSLHAHRIVNAAGLDADAVARRIVGTPPERIPQVYFAKGNYASLSAPCPFSRLIYPVPVPGGLGTHLTLDMGGQAQFGPDVEWLGAADPSREPGSTAAMQDFRVDEARLAGFVRDVQTWWPSLPTERLRPAYSGIRPKLSNLGEPVADFQILGPSELGLDGLVHLFGIESPGLTASLAIAEVVEQKLLR